MNKEEFIKRYGEAAREKHNQQRRDWYVQHREEKNTKDKEWRENNPEEVKINSQEANRKGGKYYAKKRQYETTGIQRVKRLVRAKHQKRWNKYKQIVAPESELHHEWIPDTANYRGVALVEKNPHRYGIVNPILILDGEITLFTETEIKEAI